MCVTHVFRVAPSPLDGFSNQAAQEDQPFLAGTAHAGERGGNVGKRSPDGYGALQVGLSVMVHFWGLLERNDHRRSAGGILLPRCVVRLVGFASTRRLILG